METEEAQDLRLHIQIYSISKINKEFVHRKMWRTGAQDLRNPIRMCNTCNNYVGHSQSHMLS